jgi:2-methylcitrate dehydratase
VGRISSIEVDIYEFALRFAADTPDKWAPSNIETADHSIPFMTAHALARGSFGLGALHDTLHDDVVRALASKVSVKADPAFTAAFPAMNGARVSVIVDGERLVAETPAALGHPSRRLTREDARAKFMEGAARIVDEPSARAWMARIEAMASAPNVASLLAP